jgi:hypothetical protein
VLEDQQLLRERILHLTGAAGVSRMESAIMEARAQYTEAREKGNPPPSAFASPQKAKVAPSPPPPPIPSSVQLDPGPRKGPMNALSQDFDATDHKACMDLEKDANALLDNEKLLNDMLHEPNLSVFGAMYTSNKAASRFEEIQATTRSRSYHPNCICALYGFLRLVIWFPDYRFKSRRRWKMPFGTVSSKSSTEKKMLLIINALLGFCQK